jgi:putative spermidine/putrescine transport system ATP-binding protein
MPPGIELEVCGLTKRYSPQVSVGPISFEVQKGEFFSLLGPSGCGKTTTLRCIAGFETLTEGSISLHGERLDDKPPHRRDIGLVFQNYALFPHLTVFDNVAFGLRLRRLGKAEIADRVGRVLQLVDLAGMAARFPVQLSGGQQQRVAIARSLVLEPRILMFDEPLSNLDFKLRIQMREELRSLQRRLGKTSIYVTHDQTEALALSDRIAVLSHGRIEQIGTPAEIYECPAQCLRRRVHRQLQHAARPDCRKGRGRHDCRHRDWVAAVLPQRARSRERNRRSVDPAAARADPRRGARRARHAGTKSSIRAHRRHNLSGRGPSP